MASDDTKISRVGNFKKLLTGEKTFLAFLGAFLTTVTITRQIPSLQVNVPQRESLIS